MACGLVALWSDWCFPLLCNVIGRRNAWTVLHNISTDCYKSMRGWVYSVTRVEWRGFTASDLSGGGGQCLRDLYKQQPPPPHFTTPVPTPGCSFVVFVRLSVCVWFPRCRLRAVSTTEHRVAFSAFLIPHDKNSGRKER